jgi:endoglucanase
MSRSSMRRPGPHARVLVACGLVLTLLLVATGAGDGSASQGLAVRVVGAQLVDAAGYPIRLLGVNRSGAEYPCVQGWALFDGPTDAQSIGGMATWGINAVRLPLNEDCWLGINGVSAARSGVPYRAAVTSYVARLHLAGLYVILDLHWNAPGGELATGQQPMADLDHAPAFWSSVAQTFRSDPAVLFDLYNEPQRISWRCWRDGCTLPAGWAAAGMQTLVDAVRATGARQPIILSGLNWATDLTGWLRYRPHDPANQLVAGFHAFDFAHCATVGCWNRTIAPVARRVPVITSEFGEKDCTPAFADRYMSWADPHGISYLGWVWAPFGCAGPSLIDSWDGQPTAFGAGVRDHLLTLRMQASKGAQ